MACYAEAIGLAEGLGAWYASPTVPVRGQGLTHGRLQGICHALDARKDKSRFGGRLTRHVGRLTPTTPMTKVASRGC